MPATTMLCDGVLYAVLSEQEEIRKYVFGEAHDDWDPSDFAKYGDELQSFEWKLEEVSVGDIRVGPEQPEPEELDPRVEKFAQILGVEPIPPIVLRGSDLLIFDGYGRTYALRKKGITKCLAYVGR